MDPWQIRIGIVNLLKKGFLHIVATNVTNKLLAVLTNILIARAIGKYNYGVFGAAFNVYSLFILLSGLGMTSAILIFCSEKRSESEKKTLYAYGLRAGLLVDVLLCIAMVIYGEKADFGIEDARQYVVLLAALPIADYVVQYILVVFRSRKENKIYSLLLNISSISYFVFGCLGAKYFGVSGTIFGRYLSYALVIVIMQYYLCKQGISLITKAPSLSRELKRSLWKYSIKNGISNTLNQILYLIDVTLIVALIHDAEVVATYKVAVMIPEGLTFIPNIIMVFVVPYFAEHNADGEWLRKNIKVMFAVTGLLNLAISSTLIIGAPFIIQLLWGKEYLDGVLCFRILSLSYFFLATIRMPCTNILAAMKKVNFNLVVGVVAGITNICLDYVLIFFFSSTGAAVATLATVLVVSAISLPYLIVEIKKMSEFKE